MSEVAPAPSRDRVAATARALLPRPRTPGPAPSAATLLYLRGHDADGRIRRLVAERHALRPALGALALRLVRRRAHEPLGFRSLGDYARERLGATAHVVREWSRVWEALGALPRLRAAVVSGEVSWSVARRAVAHASRESDEAFAAALRGRTVRAAEALLRAAFGDEAAARAEAEPQERLRIHVPLPAEHHGRWRTALELARRMAGEALPVWECAEAIAAEALGALPATSIEHAEAECGVHAEPSAAPLQPAPQVAPPSREHGLRHVTFPSLRWATAGPAKAGAAPALARIEAWADAASPHALDRALRRALRRLQSLDHDLGHLLRQMLERRLYRELGFPSFERYAEERADVSPRTARRFVRFARLGPVGSAAANAFRTGALTARQAALVSAAAPPPGQAELVAFARGVTLRRLEDELGAASSPAVVFSAPPEAANVFRLALAAARHHTGASTPEALLWMLDNAIAAWQEQGDAFHDYADFGRDGWRCTVPGCTARRNLQSHHIVFRSHGGADEPWNRTTLCAFHHLRGIHARQVACTGRAPEGLTFALGLRATGPPLLRARSGDVLVA